MDRYAYLGQSIKYPLQITEQGRPALSTGFDNIKESVYEILSTPVGSRFQLREYGSRLEELLFEPNDDILIAELEYNILDALDLWEKRIEVTTVVFEQPVNSPSLINCDIQYEILQSNTVDSTIFPFYRRINT